MLSRAARLIVLGSFLASIGMHTAVLQAAAWAKMTVEFARRDTIAASLQKTFDGEHPCAICLSLRKAARPVQSLVAVPSHSPLVFVAPSSAPRVSGPAAGWRISAPVSPQSGRSPALSSPPPKDVLS